MDDSPEPPDPFADDRREETTVRAEACARDQAFVDWFLLSFATAVRIDPERMRQAVGSLFDLSLWEKDAHRIAATCQWTAGQLREARELLAAVRQDFERLEGDFDRLRFSMEQYDRQRAAVERKPVLTAG